jgi:hypothetical protein
MAQPLHCNGRYQFSHSLVIWQNLQLVALRTDGSKISSAEGCNIHAEQSSSLKLRHKDYLKILKEISFITQKALIYSMMFRIVFWDILPCKMIVDRRFRGAYCLHHQGWVDNHFTRQYIPEDNSEHHTRRRENLKSQKVYCFPNVKRRQYIHLAPSHAEQNSPKKGRDKSWMLVSRICKCVNDAHVMCSFNRSIL